MSNLTPKAEHSRASRSYCVRCACRFNDFDAGSLRHLSLLQHLTLNDMQLSNFEILPGSWPKLRVLELAENELTQLPRGLSQASRLTALSLENQKENLQIRGALCFLTQLQHLREVRSLQSQEDAVVNGALKGHAWNEGSLFALMQARLLIQSTPGCQVVLLD